MAWLQIVPESRSESEESIAFGSLRGIGPEQRALVWLAASQMLFGSRVGGRWGGGFWGGGEEG